METTAQEENIYIQANQHKSALPAYMFEPEYMNKVDVDFTNVALITRNLVEINPKTKLPGLVCFCKDSLGKQIPALKKTARSYVCGNANSRTIQKCGFRIGASTLCYLHKYSILKDSSNVVFPVCKTCSFSWLMHSTNEKIRDQLGCLTFICNCDPYSAKISIPINDPAVSRAFDMNAYEKACKDVRTTRPDSMLSELMSTTSAATASHYIPE
jgi:hypothetical protein